MRSTVPVFLALLVGFIAAIQGCSGGACPEPHPQLCGAITECPCNDGTTQEGGCVNGFTCEEACCAHDGSHAGS